MAPRHGDVRKGGGKKALVKLDTHARAETAFQAYRCSLAVMSLFKYLGWVLTTSDNDWLVVISNLWKSR